MSNHQLIIGSSPHHVFRDFPYKTYKTYKTYKFAEYQQPLQKGI